MAKRTDSNSHKKNCKELVKRDLSCVWHPFTQAKTALDPLCIVKGQGAYLYSETGDSYLDAISSWWVNLHGHSHPYIACKIAEQARTLEHVIFAGHTHPQAVIFAERLLRLFSNAYSRVFFSDNGSTAVESALKMAFQVKGNGKKLLSFSGGYHGDTFGAMSAAGKSHYNAPFWPYLFQIHSIRPPILEQEEASWKEFEIALETGDIAAFIFEPLIQGAAGMVPHSASMLGKMVQRCKKEGIITIADEVMTGFGRTGNLFACHSLKVLPDLMCLSKGITGGFLPMGVTLAKPFIFESFLADDPANAFLHGHSYTANPIACAAANASLDLLLTAECVKSRQMIESEHLHFQREWGGHPQVQRCNVQGTILALEYKLENASYHHPLKIRLSNFFRSHGVLIRPLGNVLYLIPPYCVSREDLQKIYALIAITLEDNL